MSEASTPSKPPQGSPPEPYPGFGVLRAALEEKLRQEPGAGTPPPKELEQLLGLPLPPPKKCLLVDGEQLLRDNLSLSWAGPPLGVAGLRRALSILEKYGRNLLQPRPPRHWRSVRSRNPVYSGALGGVKGSRAVLALLGYSQQAQEGLSFPPWVLAPDPLRVASVTADLLLLGAELELLLRNLHPNPQFFTELLQQEVASDSLPIVDGGRARGQAPPTQPRPGHTPSEEALSSSSSSEQGWSCSSCTFLNPAPSVLCGACDRPRLAHRPRPCSTGWSCPHCTYQNEGRGQGQVCAVCLRPPGPSLVEPGPAPSSSSSEATPIPKATPTPGPAPSREAERQRRLKEEGSKVLSLLRAAEAQGLPPELVVPTALKGVAKLPAGQVGAAWAWSAVGVARAELGAELRRLAGAGEASLGPFSTLEAARAWGKALGEPERAKMELEGSRRRKLRALVAQGFEEGAAAAALGGSWGQLGQALGRLQGAAVRPFLSRLWEPEPPLDFDCQDQQALCRRVLASLGAGSWGRALLVTSLGKELGLGKAWARGRPLQELLEAVGQCPERARLLRLLRCHCRVCGLALPRQQALSLTSCQCWLCPECFRLHFTLGVRERRVLALGCPSCGLPDMADEAQRLSYFSTLDVQLRQCLDPDTYQLFTQKLTELELLKDPKFLWCIQCSFGFIFEAEQGPAQCPQCQQSFCPRCQRQWDPNHSSMSCEEFGAWLGACDPQVEAVGLESFLQELSIACPQCGLCFALARGGCLHLQCSQCQHHFCCGCLQPFHTRGACPTPGCPLVASLHCHHPRDCLFYLRDWDPQRLQALLKEAGVPFETEPVAGMSIGGGCPVLEQKEAGAGLKDEACGRETEPGMAGLCRCHYSEFLVRLLNSRGLDPAPLYTPGELRAAAERHLPAGRAEQGPAESHARYRERLRAELRRHAPLRPRPLPAARGGGGRGRGGAGGRSRGGE